MTSLNRIPALVALGLVVAIARAEPTNGRTDGDWESFVGTDGVAVAGTTDALGRNDIVFAYRCIRNPAGCQFVISPQVECADGREEVALINSNGLARLTQVHCGRNSNGESVLVPTSHKEVIDALKNGGSDISFTIAISPADFKVLRFSLSGAMAAIIRAESLAGWSEEYR